MKALIFAMGVVQLCYPVLAEPYTLQGDTFSLNGLLAGNVEMKSLSNRLLVTFSGFRFPQSGVSTSSGTPSIITSPDGSTSIKVIYRLTGDFSEQMRIEGVFSMLPSRVHAHFDIWSPEESKVVAAIFGRIIGAGASSEQICKIGRWMRHANGGVPCEKPDGLLFRCTWFDQVLIQSIPGDSNYADSLGRHINLAKVEPGHFTADADFLIGSKEFNAKEAASRLNNRPLSIELISKQPFNLWETNFKPLPLFVQTINTSDSTRSIDLSYWARDFNGNIVASGTSTIKLGAGKHRLSTLKFRASNRGILYVEVKATSGKDEEFARTTLGVLPPYQFKSGSESIFGIAAYFPIPTEADVLKLLKRMGVKWARRNDPRILASNGMTSNWLDNQPPAAYKNDPTGKNAYIRQLLQDCDARGNAYLEFGNEWNMDGGVENATLAATYVNDWLLPIANTRQQLQSKVQLMSVGLAGPDTTFLQKVYDLGGWNSLATISLHPARGNCTADYAGPETYWTFLGAVQRTKSKVTQLGTKPIWVTEAYASTTPNNWWHDSLRTAAENVVLTYALALEEGIRQVQWYQLQDAVWYDTGGVSDTDPQYHYGLLNRDSTIKASLFAYCTIAEALDKAAFVRWMKFSNPNTKGLMFNTANGPVAVLWNRADGYILAQSSPNYASPEPWIDRWTTKTPTDLPAAGASVRVVDCIGQETVYRTQNGSVRVVLDGAPRIVYGLPGTAGQ